MLRDPCTRCQPTNEGSGGGIQLVHGSARLKFAEKVSNYLTTAEWFTAEFHFFPHEYEPSVSRQGREGTADGEFLMHPAHKAAVIQLSLEAESQEWA